MAHQIDINQRALDRLVPEQMPKVAVNERLAALLFIAGGGAAQFVAGDVTRFEFFDQPRAGFELDATVDATRDVCGPIVHRNFCLNKHFAAITRPGGNALSKHATVKFRAEPEPIPTFALTET